MTKSFPEMVMKPQGRVLCFIVPLLLWVGAGETSTQQPETTHTRAIPLGVFDKEGKPVLGLTANQIRLRGVEADLRLTYDDSSRRIVLLLDMSGSMKRGKKWEHAKAFVQTFFELAGPADQLTLHAFAERHEKVVALLRSPEVLAAELDRLPAPGSRECKARFGLRTALADALLAVADLPLGFGDIVLLLSDYIALDSSRVSHKTAARLLANRGVRFFYFNFEDLRRAAPPPALPAPALAKNFANNQTANLIARTGGGELHLAFILGRRWQLSTADISLLARRFYANTRNLHRLELQLNQPLKKKRKLKIRVLDEQGRKRKDLQVFYPSVLYPVPADRDN